MSANLAPFLKRIVIDDKQFAPARIRRLAGRRRLIFPDHYPILVEFENLPKSWMNKKQTSSWNLSKPNGLDKYRALTEAASRKMDEVIENEELTIEKVAAKIETMETKIKFQAFGKTQPSTKEKVS